MPYKSERIKLPQNLDRRRKLSDADKSEILSRYKLGGVSMNSLAFGSVVFKIQDSNELYFFDLNCKELKDAED